jgi:hypothetical protein
MLAAISRYNSLLNWLKELYPRLYKKREKESGIKWLKAGIWKLRGIWRGCEREGATVFGGLRCTTGCVIKMLRNGNVERTCM